MDERQRETRGGGTVMYRCSPEQCIQHRAAPRCVPCMELERTMWRKAMRESQMPDALSVHFFHGEDSAGHYSVCVSAREKGERMTEVGRNKSKIMRRGNLCVHVSVCIT